jgi:hypothetical protein
MATGDGYDVSDLLDPTVDANKITHAQAKRWAELAYMQGQWSRDAEIEKLRGAYRAALGAEAEAKERMTTVFDAYDKIAEAVDTSHAAQLIQALAKMQEDRNNLRAALNEIKSEQGKVCADYETCDHVACRSSYTSWTIADQALQKDKDK